MMISRLFILFSLLWMGQVTIAQSVTCAGAPPSRLVVGEQAQVTTDGGSNLRLSPSSVASLLTIIPTEAIIPVVDGPFCSEQYTWWQVDYGGERGWIAEGVDEVYWLAPYLIQRAQIDTVRIEIQPTLVTDIRIERLPDPPRSQFILEGYPVQSEQISPFVVIFDDNPDIVFDETIIAQREIIADGTRTVEIRIADPTQAETDISLVYHYTRLLEDNRFVDAYFPIETSDLPLPYNPPQDAEEATVYLDEYLQTTIDSLNALSDDAFTPSLTALDNLIRSLQYDAPSENSDLIGYTSDFMVFDYHPVLATTIDTTDTILTLRDYPFGEGMIHLYNSTSLESNVILNLQQTLQRQPTNPPQIPIPSLADATITSREELVYLSFVNGSGVRYLVDIDETRYYSFQGLSSDGSTVISALFMIDEDTDLTQLDNLIMSLQLVS